MDFLLQKIEQILRHQKKWKKWQKVVVSLACIVVFITTYALILPAITMDRDEAKSQGGIFWEESQDAEETVASADEQGTAQDGILSAEEASLNAESDMDEEYVSDGYEENSSDNYKSDTAAVEEQAGTDISGEENSVEEGSLNPEAVSERPAATFDEVAGDVTVHVEAPEGAFPAGTTMKVEPVAEEQVIDAVQEAVEESVTKVSAVNIIFLDVLGNEIEPKAEIRVSMSSSVMESVEQPVIVHVDEKGVGETVESEQVDGAVVFESDRFSVYVLVETEITTKYITAEGETYTITVTYGPEAEIPDGATLEVSELENDNKEYTKYVEQAAKALSEGEEIPFVNAARLFDISIMADGKKIEPKVPVEVRIEYANAESLNETSEVGAVHFKKSFLKNETEVIDINIQGEEDKIDGVTFIAESFSIYAVIIIDKEAGTFVVEDENYRITITYTKEANIPIGTKLIVDEIPFNSDEYWSLWNKTIEKLNESTDTYNELSESQKKGITAAKFFDIALLYGDNEIEPDVPLQVRIEYLNENGIFTPNGEKGGVVHFGNDTIELINEVRTVSGENDNVVKEYTYMQPHFSPVGTYSTGEYIDQTLPVRKNLQSFEAPRVLGTNTKNGDEGDGIKMSARKYLDPNGDGTSTLHLALTGQAESQSDASVPKVNIVLVVDTSGSMDTPIEYRTYSDNAQTAFNSSTEKVAVNNYGAQAATAPNYYGIQNGQYVRIVPVKIPYYTYTDYSWRYATDLNTQYNGTVYTAAVTRLDSTKEALYTLVDALLANNKPGETLTDKDGNVISLADITEITLISFAGSTNNDENGYLTTQIQNVTTAGDVNDDNTIKGKIAGLNAVGGTNWEETLKLAKAEADSYKNATPDEQTVVIFVTDGMPTFYGNDLGYVSPGYWSNYVWHEATNYAGREQTDNVHMCWTNAADDAYALKEAGYDLYSIFAYGANSSLDGDSPRKPYDYLLALQNYYETGAGTYTNTTDNENFYNATNTTQLQEALKKIANKINNVTAFGAVDVHDGVSFGATSTSLFLENGSLDPSSFTYTVTGDTDSDCYTVRIQNGIPVFTIGKNEPQTVNGSITTVKVPNPEDPNDRSKDLTCTVYSVTVGEGDNAKTYSMTPAKLYTEEGGNRQGIEWDLTGVGLIQDGITYDLSFIVWPNQTAYDLVSMLENGELTEAQAADSYPDIWPYVNKTTDPQTGSTTYSLATNWEQKVSYYQVDQKTENDETTYTYNKQPDMELETGSTTLARTSMDMTKVWNDSLDDSQIQKLLYADYPANTQARMYEDENGTHGYQVYLRLYKDDTYDGIENKISEAGDNYEKRFTLGWKQGTVFNWSEDYSVAPGVMVKNGSIAAKDLGLTPDSHDGYDIAKYNNDYYFILEEGHYYAVTEENIDDHFILEKHIFHPMVVDSITQDVTFEGVDEGDPYHAIIVSDVKQMTAVYATNTLRGGINITKEVKDHTGTTLTYEDSFYGTITLTPSSRTETIEDYWEGSGDNRRSKGKVAWYRYYDGDTAIRDTEVLKEAGILTAEGTTGDNGAIYDGDGWFYLWFQEYGKDESIHNATGTVAITPKYTLRFTNMASGTGYSFDETETHGMTKTVSGGTGEVQGNTESNISVTNTTSCVKIRLLKDSDGDTNVPLKDAWFQLYYDEECTKLVKTNASGSSIGETKTLDGVEYSNVLVSGDGGIMEVGTMVSGIYYLYEIKAPSGYNKLSEAVLMNVSEDSVKLTQYDVIHTYDSRDSQGYYVVGVSNSTGRELPHTGGSGTLPYTLSGIALVMASALMYGFRMRRGERRFN